MSSFFNTVRSTFFKTSIGWAITRLVRQQRVWPAAITEANCRTRWTSTPGTHVTDSRSIVSRPLSREICHRTLVFRFSHAVENRMSPTCRPCRLRAGRLRAGRRWPGLATTGWIMTRRAMTWRVTTGRATSDGRQLAHTCLCVAKYN